MRASSSPEQVARLAAAHAELWRAYLTGLGVAKPEVLARAPWDYWALLYPNANAMGVFQALNTAFKKDRYGALLMLCDLEDLFKLEWHGFDSSIYENSFDTFFTPDIWTEPEINQYVTKGLLGLIRAQGFMRALQSLEIHLADEDVTVFCLKVANSQVYRTAMQRVGAFIAVQVGVVD